MGAIKAVFFDQDGVIIDTERDGHRVSFNETFKYFGLPLAWSVEEYHTLLQTGGGKERMRRSFGKKGLFSDLGDEALNEKIEQLHRFKTDHFIAMLSEGRLPLRPGIFRLMKQINEAGLILGVTTTSHERTANAITGKILKDIRFDFILADDMVSRKKPDPEIYLKALDKAGILPDEGVVIEDSNIGVRAAKAAGLKVVATVNGYTREEDMSQADLVLSSLGDEAEPAGVIRGEGFAAKKEIGLGDLTDYFRRSYED